MYARFKFNEPLGTTTFLNSGTVVGNLVATVNGATCQIASLAGQAPMVIDQGSNDAEFACALSDSNLKNFRPSQFTVGGWVYVDVLAPVGGDNLFASNGLDAGNCFGIDLFNNPPQDLLTYLDVTTFENASIPTMIGGWHHVAVTFDGATAKTYYDGVLQASTPAVMNYPALLSPTNIGWYLGQAEPLGVNNHRIGFSDWVISDTPWDSWIADSYAAGPFGYPSVPGVHKFFIILPSASATPLASLEDW